MAPKEPLRWRREQHAHAALKDRRLLREREHRPQHSFESSP